MEHPDPTHYLAASPYIDWQHPSIVTKAQQLAAPHHTAKQIAQACFEFVRDDIKHSLDYEGLTVVTCKASEVLHEGSGFCYAKSHLLAALLRANGIPAGLCYQRLTLTDQPPYCLHGLNAIYLPHYGWYRVDARGNKPEVNAQFTPPVEQLAFQLIDPYEKDIEGIFAEPLPMVIALLTQSQTVQEVVERLPWDSEVVA
ncbi:transglutaminase-like domain-containing protein [Thiolinea disciformis]|uniref:transglutaminase-like domain-containing protein n=1 Tax=Thiolinea disciformis TaxID=125614 RepID=UPI000379EE20|nr:transglutaminase family protein [Thiolinea disciformis]